MTDSRESVIRFIQSNNIESVLSVEISTNSAMSAIGAVRTSTKSSMMFRHSIILVHNGFNAPILNIVLNSGLGHGNPRHEAVQCPIIHLPGHPIEHGGFLGWTTYSNLDLDQLVSLPSKDVHDAPHAIMVAVAASTLDTNPAGPQVHIVLDEDEIII